jgi:hypothetical protein
LWREASTNVVAENLLEDAAVVENVKVRFMETIGSKK